MRRLKIILFFSLSFAFVLRIFNAINYESIYQNGEIVLEGTITNIKYDNEMTTIFLKAKENIVVKYYEHINLKTGDNILINGNISEPNRNKVFNLFNYKKYLLSKRIYKVLKADSISYINKNFSTIYKIKNKIYNRLNTINNSYLHTFILADNQIDDTIYNTYQNNGVSHLFSISGMHIGLFSFIILKVLNIFFKNRMISYIITDILLFIYMILIGTPSIIRSVLLFIFISIKKILKINVNVIYLLLLAAYIMLLYNPFYIYDIGFQYSFIISFVLIKFSYLYQKKSYFLKLFIISLLATLCSFPITINNNFEINIFSSIVNLIFVPVISFIYFPISLIVFIFPPLNDFYIFLIEILEKLSLFINNHSIILTFGHMNNYIVFLYYIVLYCLLNKIKFYKIGIMISIIILQYNIHHFNFYNRITMIDVGQGDSILLEFENDLVVLIDTGGNFYYSLATSTIIPYIKSLGIRKIDYMILTHGDYDHMGESIELVNNFKIDNVILNNGSFNKLELELIEVLDKKEIDYYKNIKKFDIDKYSFYFLNNEIYNDENSNSIVIYINIEGNKLLLMGDANINVEQDILNKYNINNIDILKVGHHGSNTSSYNKFIETINPKYSLISVGKNNKFGHPNLEVLDILKRSKIYRTDINGSIMIKIKNEKFKIKTCIF